MKPVEHLKQVNRRKTLLPYEVPSQPWEKAGTDLFEFRNNYLITADYYSNFWEVDKLPDTKASTAILKIKNHFTRYGCPDKVVSDNGPKFSYNKFAMFAWDWEFKHQTISPGNSKANGKVESAVKTAKWLLCKACEAATDPYLAILDYRNTLTQGVGSSPVQRLMSRRTKTLLPATNQLLQMQASKPSYQQAKLIKWQNKQEWHYNHTGKDLQPLDKGDIVSMKPLHLGEKKWCKALVIEKRNQRSNTMETSEGGVYCHNQVHLRKTPEQPPTIMQDNEPLPPSNSMPSKPADDTETLPSKHPTCKASWQDKWIWSVRPQVAEHQNPSPMTLRPARVRRPPERLRDCLLLNNACLLHLQLYIAFPLS